MYLCSAGLDNHADTLIGSLVLLASASRKAYTVHIMYPCSARTDDEAYRLIGSLVAHCKC
jgi:hypothetical protein